MMPYPKCGVSRSVTPHPSQNTRYLPHTGPSRIQPETAGAKPWISPKLQALSPNPGSALSRRT